MAGAEQKSLGNAESGGADSPSHATTNDPGIGVADTDRFGSGVADNTTPIPGPRNHISDDVWGWNNTAGGANAPEAPGIIVASK